MRPTIKGRLVVDSPVDRAWLLLLMRNFRDAVEYAHSLMRKGCPDVWIVKLLASRILNNAHYSYSALMRARLYGNQPYLPYGAGIYLKKNGRMELHVNVPLELYVKHLNKTSRHYNPRGHVASFDLNSDRICMVIVSRDGNLLDVKTEHFPEVTSHGFPKDKAKDIRMKALARLVSYAHHHGVTDYVAERLSKPKTKTLSKSANRKITKFALREYIKHLRVLVPRYSGRLHFVNPAYTSVDAIPLAKKLGLDIHTTSAYLLALRYLNLTFKPKHSAVA